MPVPPFDKLFRPVLELAAREPITRTSANEAMTRLFKLTPAEIDEKLASGGSKMRNRTGWAMTFLTKASLIEKIAPKTYRATARGLEFLKAHPTGFTEAELRALPGYEEAWEEGRQKRLANAAQKPGGASIIPTSTETPEEIIEHQVKALNAIARERLLQAILDQTPEFFEHLVLEVLEAVEGPIRGQAHGDEPNHPTTKKLDAICRQSAEQIRRHFGKIKVADLNGRD